MSHPIPSEFDIVFAGGRLAAYDPSLRILILEAVPTSTTVTFNIGNPSPRLNGRAPIVPCGRCVGWRLMFMVYTRPPASDYDDWETNGWESESLIPLMKKLETYEVQPDLPTHGYDGPIKVSSGGCKVGICDEFIQAVANFWLMYKRYIDGTTGRRSDAAHHYVYNQAHNSNLQVWDGKLVKRIIFKDKRAVGVEFTSDPVSCPDADRSSSIVRASKLVVVSAGAFGSPTILERSGIGAEAILKRCGIEQLVNLPGVGENYQDHNLAIVPYLAADNVVTMDALWRGESILQESLAQWNSSGKSLIAQKLVQVITAVASIQKIKWRPDDEELKAMDPAFQPRWKEFFQDRPDKPVAIFTSFAGPSDIVPLDFGYKKTREVFRRMASYRGEVAAGHPDFPEGSAAACREASGPVDLNAPDIVYTAEDDEAINQFHRDIVQTAWHSLGTCAMKPEADQGVVDARLDVYDMSIVPLNVGANTYSTALLIGERAAMIIAEELGINCI
ncbi:GMC oxidoreductase-domain-containing protein [Suillus subalutaceus]|uniref:GMC oxidoreductase-domain-containing protein n=1 Tax=Suillus subalutaceus TaxID=48586 RepID=UPI001B876964|nr:GMC oxidoreductase-domain-containing protein [Suillus subalutaceus]KAG1865880.1 GMC oxidoreductase-domain-containing protein [Suillus subalutaceus]